MYGPIANSQTYGPVANSQTYGPVANSQTYGPVANSQTYGPVRHVSLSTVNVLWSVNVLFTQFVNHFLKV